MVIFFLFFLKIMTFRVFDVVLSSEALMLLPTTNGTETVYLVRLYKNEK